jgi:hypothetical protein
MASRDKAQSNSEYRTERLIRKHHERYDIPTCNAAAESRDVVHGHSLWHLDPLRLDKDQASLVQSVGRTSWLFTITFVGIAITQVETVIRMRGQPEGANTKSVR